MIGIKGVGMTMLAQFLHNSGFDITGSDVEEVFMTDKVLKESGIKVIKGFDKNNIPADADLIVYSTSYNVDTNEEVKAVLSGKKKVMTYAEALGSVFNEKYGIAVVGSHGKTTTTAWLGYVLEKSGKSPSVMVGAAVKQFGGASLNGQSDILLIEADEYQNKLKYFNPKAVLLNNIDYDHPDFFPTVEDYNKAFIDFIGKIPKSGFLVANFDDKVIRKTANVNCRARVISYSIDAEADYVAYDIKHGGGKQYFKVKLGVDEMSDDEDELPNSEVGDFAIRLPGKHNIYNALAVIAASIELGVPLNEIREHLEDFEGTNRRMEVLGDFRGATIIDDYAHHPAEIKATLSGIRELYGDRRIKVVFHPHTFTRTKAFLDDFSKSFGDADEVIVLDIYGSAREKQGGVSSEDLVELIKQSPYAEATADKENKKTKKKEIKHIATLAECEKYLRENIQRDDVIVLMGAGDVFRVGENLLK
jgi:UDP-N-acetylmuramate--alanine ligase